MVTLYIPAWIDREDVTPGRDVYTEDENRIGSVISWDKDTGALELDTVYTEEDLFGRPLMLKLYGPLRQFIDVLGLGFDLLKEDMKDFVSLHSIDDCPDEFLPHLAAMFGFEFPHDLGSEQQRNYLRTIISMYRTKGTAWALRLAAVRILGQGFDLAVYNEDRENHTFSVSVTANSDEATPQLEQKIEYLVEQYSPAGMIPSISVIYYFLDEVDNTRQTDDDFHSTEITLFQFNRKAHRMNQNLRLNSTGEILLNI